MIEGARRVWKQLSLMEDAMLISRIMRAPERRIFYTDIGNIPPNEVDAYMQKMMDKMKKVPYIDEQTGEYNLRFNLQNMIEDYYIPVRGGDSGTKIDTLAGMEWTGIDDLEYIKTKMMAALKIPKAFLGYEEGISGKATLASEDVRFARTIQRLQRIIASELSKIAIVHLYAQGYRDESLVDFEIELTNPSTVFEKEKIEIWQDKIGVAIDMVENKFFSYEWVYKNIFNMSEDDIQEVKEQVVDDAKHKYRLTKIEEDGDDPAKPFKKIGGKGKGDDDDEGGLGDLDIGGGGGHGGGGGSMPDLDDLGGDEEGEKGEKGDKDTEGDEDLGDIEKDLPDDLKKLKESTDVRVDDRDRSDRDQSDRDQSGEKKMPAIAEDPLGALSRHETPKKKSEGKPVSAISHNFEGGSPLRIKEAHKQKPVMDRGMIGGLAEFINKTHEETKKELLAEAKMTGSKSMLDPSNILE
jgi:predicted small metal-binding protein